MATADKKTNQGDTGESLSVIEGQAHVHHHCSSLGDGEPIKNTVLPAALQDPFIGEENGQVQYRSMKWWWVICLLYIRGQG